MTSSGYAIATLVVFIISVFFVVHPVTVPSPRPIPRIPINLITAPLLAIALLWATNCLNPEVIRNGIIGTSGIKPYSILILFLSLAYVATTLDITGILQAAAFWVGNRGGQSGRKVYFYFYLMFTLLSIPLGCDPILLSGTASLVYYTEASRLEPRAWFMAGFAAAHIASMVLLIGNSTNVVICEAFGINSATFTAYTIPPFFVCSVFCFAALVFQYRQQVPRQLLRAIHRDPRTALLDRTGACVGSLALVAILVLSLLCSLFKMDVWKISLLLSIAKFLFDLVWDHYRHTHGIPMLGRKSAKDVKKADDTQRSRVADEGRTWSTLTDEEAAVQTRPETCTIESETEPLLRPIPGAGTGVTHKRQWYWIYLDNLHDRLDRHFPTFITALPRLPFALVPYMFSQFILVEALDHQGWVNVFSRWLIRATGNHMQPTIWIVGILEVVLSSLLGTNISATIFLTRVIRAAALPYDANLGAAIALAVASNIGAVGFTFSALPVDLLWRTILGKNGIHVTQRDFALGNLLPLFSMTTVGLGIVSVEMTVLSRP